MILLHFVLCIKSVAPVFSDTFLIFFFQLASSGGTEKDEKTWLAKQLSLIKFWKSEAFCEKKTILVTS